jgi:hypothetical protein
MALTLLHSKQASTLKLEDLQRHPKSSLTSMVSSVAAKDGPVTLKLDELPDSPLAGWPEAVNITTALYRCATHAAALPLPMTNPAQPGLPAVRGRLPQKLRKHLCLTPRLNKVVY